ncbi:MAG: DinB family protein [Chitinophagaceae bacterium]
MATKDAFIAELKHETSLTKKMLERVPFDKKDWKPHEKSMSLGRLATHTAETIKWVSDVILIDDFNFMKDYSLKFAVAPSQEELMQLFQANLDKAIADLSAMNEDDFGKIWTVRRGEQVLFETPKKIAIRGWAFSHMIHHRGQLSVYLRLLDVHVPGMYGPSADEK